MAYQSKWKKDFNDLTKKIKDLDGNISSLEMDIDWFKKHNIIELFENFESNENLIKKLYHQLEKFNLINMTIEKLTNTEWFEEFKLLFDNILMRERQNFFGKIKGVFKDLVGLTEKEREQFIKEQINIRKEEMRKNLAKINFLIDSYKLKKQEILLDISKYKDFDLEEYRNKLNALGLEKREIEIKLNSLEKIQIKFENCYGDIIKLYEEKSRQIEICYKDIEEATILLRDLQNTDPNHRYEKKLIHEKSEALFGDGNINKVLSNRKEKLKILQRDLEKFNKKLNEKEKFYDIRGNITHLIIDGSNLCYINSGDKKFIGLKALIVLSSSLISKYNFQLKIVFDKSTIHKLKMSQQKLKEKFPKEVSIHIQTHEEAADKAILDIAHALLEKNKQPYILSNDRYSEFSIKPYEYIIADRLIKFTLSTDHVSISEFDIMETII